MKIAVIDLDPILHIVANVQYKNGNKKDKSITQSHVTRRVNTIKKNCKCDKIIMFYQQEGFDNFRDSILPSYKAHRKKREAVVLWKAEILKTLDNMGAIGLSNIESDDALSICSKIYGYENVVLVSSDKDMLQVPGTHYNPYKIGISSEERWKTMTPFEADKFLWKQVIMGDSTDADANEVGILGIGEATADKLLSDHRKTASRVCTDTYREKYGEEEGFQRFQLTYKIVKLLTGSEKYIGAPAKIEVKLINDIYSKNNLLDYTNDIDAIFNFN